MTEILKIPPVRPGQPPVFIFMTGDLVGADGGERLGRDGNRFLQKPFRIAELLSALNEAPTPVVLEHKDSVS